MTTRPKIPRTPLQRFARTLVRFCAKLLTQALALRLASLPGLPFAVFIIMAVILLGIQPASAQFQWQTTHTSNGGYDQGQAQISRNELFVTVHPGYLDVEEEVEIATSGTVNTGNDPNSLEIYGNFNLPPEATVVGVLLWYGETILQGKLLSKAKADSLYEDQVDRNSTPPPRPKDPVLITFNGPGSYGFKIYPVQINASRRMRLRYHLPARLDAKGMGIALKPAFAVFMGGRDVQVHLSGGQNPTGKVDSATLEQAGSLRRIALPRNLFVTGQQLQGTPGYWNYMTQSMMPATDGLVIRPKDPLYQAMYTTTLPAGQMQGNYLHLYASIPEAAVDAAGMRMEIVVFWKWHHPGGWMHPASGGAQPVIDVNLTSLAARQAQEISTLYKQIQPKGAQIGLVHADGFHAPKAFALGAPGSAAFLQSADYLNQWQHAAVEAHVRKAAAANTNQTFDTLEYKQKTAEVFTTEMRLVRSLYSADRGVVRHIVMVSCGASAFFEGMTNLNVLFETEFAERPVSLSKASNGNFTYAGLDFFAAKNRLQTTANPRWAGVFEMPGLPSFTATATIENTHQAYDLSIKCLGGIGYECDNLVWHGKSQNAWKPTLTWQVFDAQGFAKPAYTQNLTPLAAENDTGLAVLWAGSASPFSETREAPLGPVYGFVDASASLLALEKDSLRASRGEILPTGSVPRISNPDIAMVLPNYVPGSTTNNGGTNGGNNGGWQTTSAKTRAALRATQAWQVRLASGRLELHIPGLAGLIELGEVRITLTDLNGRAVGAWQMSPTGDGIFSMTLAGAARGQTGLYWLRVEAQGLSAAKRLSLAL